MSRSIAIIGAGLTGLMCAIHLAQRGFIITVYERRSHQDICGPRYKILGVPGRSMSMDISARGIHALKNINVLDFVVGESVPMKYKIFHDAIGNQSAIPYGQYDDEQILTVSRTHLYQTLLTECQRHDNIDIQFGQRLLHIDFEDRSATIINENSRRLQQIEPEIIIGADGANSLVRELIQNCGGLPFLISYFPMSYKELTIPSDLATGFQINAMHIWPRNGMMLVAQPNLDHSFTCALLMHETGKPLSFAQIDSSKKIRALFDAHFFDASERMPTLESEYLVNPIGKLKIINGLNWSYSNFALLIGDAAHGMVPFFGQGVNCCFEDCTFLADRLDESHNDWYTVFHQMRDVRVPDANAINAMSYDNYPELFPNTDLFRLQLIKEIEAMLSANYRGIYRTYHNLVCFERVPYSFAQKVKTIQIPMLERLSSNIANIQELDRRMVKKELHDYQRHLAKLVKSGSMHENQ